MNRFLNNMDLPRSRGKLVQKIYDCLGSYQGMQGSFFRHVFVRASRWVLMVDPVGDGGVRASNGILALAINEKIPAAGKKKAKESDDNNGSNKRRRDVAA